MTGEDKDIDGKSYPRKNVIHEAGLFQGRLGFNKAIILLEDGCERFSNIDGLTYIDFRPNRISDCFDEVRRVLKQRKIIP
jgi:predicted nucleotide-binding protein